jgi:hypothetical protein
VSWKKLNSNILEDRPSEIAACFGPRSAGAGQKNSLTSGSTVVREKRRTTGRECGPKNLAPSGINRERTLADSIVPDAEPFGLTILPAHLAHPRTCAGAISLSVGVLKQSVTPGLLECFCDSASDGANLPALKFMARSGDYFAYRPVSLAQGMVRAPATDSRAQSRVGAGGAHANSPCFLGF